MPLDRRILSAPLAPRDALTLLAPIAEALHYCHGEGVVHRDLKPANIIIDSYGVPFLVDFGIAVRKSRARSATSTTKDELLGSIPYMAARVRRGRGLRRALRRLLVRRAPLRGACRATSASRSSTARRRGSSRRSRTIPPCRSSSACPTLDPDLAADRHQGDRAQERGPLRERRPLARDLRAWLKGEAVAARPPTTLIRVVQAARRHAQSILAIALSILAVVLAAVASGRAHEIEQLRRELDDRKAEVSGAALDRDSGICRALLDSARACSELGDKRRAVAVLDEAVRRFGPREGELPSLADVLHMRGDLRVELGDQGGADDLTRAAKLDPRFRR